MVKKNGVYQNHIQDKRLDKVEEHIATTNEEMGEVKVDIGKVKTDVAWIKKNYWVVATASIGGLVGAIINIALK